jgi:transposase, IS30 family
MTKTSYERLSRAERAVVRKGIEHGESLRSIASLLGRSPSTVSREVKRNGGQMEYDPEIAQERADISSERVKPYKFNSFPELQNLVNDKLTKKWSPKQISHSLADEYPDQPEKNVSHETIYQTIYLQAKGELRTELKLILRNKKKKRAPRSRVPNNRGKIKNMVMISERPAIADDRAIPGFWEGDLIIGEKNRSQVATLVERTTRYLMLVQIPGERTSEKVVQRVAEKMSDLPNQLRNSLTWDQGKEMAAHAQFTVATDMPVYFCDPHSPWQRGSNENTNRLIRDFLPKGEDLSPYTQHELDLIANCLNERPRETLNWKTPAQLFDALVQEEIDALID